MLANENTVAQQKSFTKILYINLSFHLLLTSAKTLKLKFCTYSGTTLTNTLINIKIPQLSTILMHATVDRESDG